MKNTNISIVSIVGRPNVGKSSLFNRIVGRRDAIVEEREGTTRDRIEKFVNINDKNFLIVDTGGFVKRDEDSLQVSVKNQIEKAIESSDMLLFVCDGRAGLLPMDYDLARSLRKSNKTIILVINKIDNARFEENLPEFYELGLGVPLGISCLQNRGIKRLFEEVVRGLPEHGQAGLYGQNSIKIAIVGKPNVGKSSFLNKVLDEERVIVDEVPGTTRDSIDTYFNKDGLQYLLIDTAGMRHKKRVKNAVDIYSILRTKDAIDRSDIALFLIDGAEGVTNDDAKIFNYIKEKGKGCAIIVNKWDLVKGIETTRYTGAILKKMPEARNFPVSFISAKTGKNLLSAFNLVKAIKTNLDLFIDTGTLRRFLKDIDPAKVSINRKKKIPKFYYMTQVMVRPKEFFIFVKDSGDVTEFHTSYIENRLRESFPIEGVPIKLTFRSMAKGRNR
ncbi:MAG: ribosome biogenesis GTPase Der [Candidatus Omnitrophota bacterium]